MPRRPRVFLPGHPVHVIQRGHNREQIFFGAADAKCYLDWLQDAAAVYGVAVHAYVLMTNHVHLLVSPETPQSLPRAMRDVNWHYSRYANSTRARTGSIWDGRYRACIVDADRYFFACSHYIELNPVRAGLAKAPGAYRWSSYKANAEGKGDPAVSAHALYESLGATPTARAEAYRSLFAGGLSDATLAEIRQTTNGGWALGAESFTHFVGRHAGLSMRRRGRGRPAVIAA